MGPTVATADETPTREPTGPAARPAGLAYARTRRPPSGWIGWTIVGLSAAAAGVSGYLLWRTLAEAGMPPGCGPDSGCEQVLSSRWSTWLNLPVAAPAVALYVAIAAAAVVAMFAFTPARRALARVILLGLALAAGGAAAWFVGVQFVAIGQFCTYCLAVHACGFAVAGLAVAWLIRAAKAAGGAPGRAAVAVAVLLAVGAVAGLAAGQKFQAERRPEPRIYRVRFARGSIETDLTQLPVLGRPKAPHAVLVLADYTCPHCRVLHRNAKTAVDRLGGQVSFSLAPMAMSGRCNPHIQRTAPLHADACDYALLALAVWRAKPEAFPAMDAYLFDSGDKPPPVAQARRHAAQLLGGEQPLARAEADPWVADRLKQNIEIYRLAGKGSIPKLIFEDRVVLPPDADAQYLIQLLQSQFGIKAVGG